MERWRMFQISDDLPAQERSDARYCNLGGQYFQAIPHNYHGSCTVELSVQIVKNTGDDHFFGLTAGAVPTGDHVRTGPDLETLRFATAKNAHEMQWVPIVGEPQFFKGLWQVDHASDAHGEGQVVVIVVRSEPVVVDPPRHPIVLTAHVAETVRLEDWITGPWGVRA